jgi:ABC-type glycerol-3-phosphate transport system permease component
MESTTKRRVAATAILLLPAFVHAFPVLYLLSLSFKGPLEIFDYPPRLLPQHLNLDNYRAALGTAPLGRFLWNSFIVSSSITLLQVVTSVLAAFALARLNFPGKRLILGVMLAVMMVPSEVTLVPNYLTMAYLGGIDHFAALIAPYSASGFGVFLLYQFFRTLPVELEEAVRIDGGGPWRFLWQFAVPLSAPAIVAFGVYAFVSAWNQYLWPLVVTQSAEMRTVQIAVAMLRAENEATSWGVIMAATAILIAPGVALFVATQRQFFRGVTMSGLKG